MKKLYILSIGLMVLGCSLHAMKNNASKAKEIKLWQIDVSSIIGNLVADPSKTVTLSDKTEVNQATLVLTLKRMRYLITHNPDAVVFLFYVAQNSSDEELEKLIAVCSCKDLSDEEMQSKRQEIIAVCQAHKLLDQDQKMSDEIRSIITCSLKGADIDLTLVSPLQNRQLQPAACPEYNVLTGEEKVLLQSIFGGK